MLAKVHSAALVGLTAVPVAVEADVSNGLPGVTVVGLPDTAVRESKVRIRSAIKNSQYDWPMSRMTVNLAPADARKEGSAFDFPMALGLLAASGQMDPTALADTVILGELALDGSLRPVPGILAVALSLQGKGKRLLLPAANAAEAAMVEGVEAYPLSCLPQAIQFLEGREEVSPAQVDLTKLLQNDPASDGLDFSEVKGQVTAKRAIEIAVVGSHNLLLLGPPGAGKTMLAERIPTILPEISAPEALETTLIYSVTGHLQLSRPLLNKRPFRFPHHTVSDVGLVGGGSPPKPGEISLAHHGVLFLDELPEFPRSVLESLRQPLEEGRITVCRARGTTTFPAKFMLVAAMNPCPCGFAGDVTKNCLCTPSQFLKYRSRVSGPLMDRIDLHVEVPALSYSELTEETPAESSTAIRMRVTQARARQQRRFQATPSCFANAQMRHRHLKRFCSLSEESRQLLKDAISGLGLSARAYHKILKVARTIADLEAAPDIVPHHLAEAIQYRLLDRSYADSL